MEDEMTRNGIESATMKKRQFSAGATTCPDRNRCALRQARHNLWTRKLQRLEMRISAGCNGRNGRPQWSIDARCGTYLRVRLGGAQRATAPPFSKRGRCASLIVARGPWAHFGPASRARKKRGGEIGRAAPAAAA